MSEVVAAACIQGGALIFVQVLLRAMSHFEHKAGMQQGLKTAEQVQEIHTAMNGKITGEHE